jgi:glycosyltransferase involved in cell wall biosynthesis
VHTAPDVLYEKPRLKGLGPRTLLHYSRLKKHAKYFLDKHLEPIANSDLVIVHNDVTKDSLVRHGVEVSKIRVIRHPVPSVSFAEKSDEISRNLHVQKGDVVFCTVGFLTRTKGILHAVKALSFLPENYKLAIIGGMHPDSADTSFYDEVTDAIKDSGLLERAYITGYVEEDSRLNALIRECDICIYPYDKNYYSYVSSGSLNTAIANHKPVISYPTAAFLETNSEIPVITFCKSGNYYELAREIHNIDIKKAEKLSAEYAEMYGWNKEAAKFAGFYRQLA